MARIFLLIDGYNLLHAAGLGRRRFSRGGLELARTKLLQKLAAELSDDVCRDTVVVFDAAADADGRHQQEQS
ncbi:MAG: NYN domain-containing protein, partial [Planctomyces sp.]